MFKNHRMGELADRLGYGNVELAETMGVDRGTIKRWLAGRATPSPSFLAQLADVLKVPAQELYEVPEANRNLAYYRVLAGYSLAQLAPDLGISPMHLGRIESGVAPVPNHLLDLLQRRLKLDDLTMSDAMDRSRQAKARRRPPARYELISA
ncbi:helix-turn-helix transcriptional regulator [Mycobacteroides abscessus]|uniref:helix-turn-helix transcriptional regulator n=1 Tax=Mycobacteroides abscessus TaxID=36809 RepID=UPI0009A6B20C|nr:helix-turn-helix transcriptional regulator [Mycobacteroides abscessus]SLH38753.1 putative transcriptional regulator [Mycobacteroides abscessus subsp. massiliense]